MGQSIQSVVIGPEQGLQFHLNFLDAADRDVGLAWGHGMVWLGGEPAWYWEDEEGGEPLSVQWTWIDLLEFLGRNWTELNLEESYPFHLTPDNPTALREEARKRWMGLSKARRLEEDEVLYRFEGRHDLAQAMRGIDLPSLFLMREGQLMWVCSKTRKLPQPHQEVMDVLEEVGNLLVARIDGSNDLRAIRARETWARRHVPSLERTIDLRSALNPEVRQRIQRGSPPSDFWQIENPGSDSELLAAARMSGGKLSVADHHELLQTIRRIPHGETSLLDGLAREALQALDAAARLGASLEPFEEGYALARWLREKLGNAEDRVEPEKLLMDWNVQLVDVRLEQNRLEAVACWGTKHGPAVLVNTRGARARAPHGRRSSVAHEICHLLVDRQGSLPLAEVLGGSSPSRPEQRANAFAAEFLLPQSAAKRRVQEAQGIESVIDTLCDDYGVGRQIAGWQIQNGEAWNLLDPVEQEYIDALTPPEEVSG